MPGEAVRGTFVLGGILLTGAPVLRMLASGVVGTLQAGRPVMDILLSAGCFFLAVSGMVCMAMAVWMRRRRLRPVCLPHGVTGVPGCRVTTRTTPEPYSGPHEGCRKCRAAALSVFRKADFSEQEVTG